MKNLKIGILITCVCHFGFTFTFTPYKTPILNALVRDLKTQININTAQINEAVAQQRNAQKTVKQAAQSITTTKHYAQQNFEKLKIKYDEKCRRLQKKHASDTHTLLQLTHKISQKQHELHALSLKEQLLRTQLQHMAELQTINDAHVQEQAEQEGQIQRLTDTLMSERNRFETMKTTWNDTIKKQDAHHQAERSALQSQIEQFETNVKHLSTKLADAEKKIADQTTYLTDVENLFGGHDAVVEKLNARHDVTNLLNTALDTVMNG